jgi:thioredoxin-related protein
MRSCLWQLHFAASLGLLLSSCGMIGKKPIQPTDAAPNAEVTTRGWALLYPELLKGDPGAEPGVVPGSAPGGEGGTPSAAEGGMFDFSGVVQTGAQASTFVNWQRSAADALKLSRTTGKPLLTLFTHQMSQPAQSLESTFLRTPEFRELAETEFVLLRLNCADQDTARSDYYRDFKKRLKATGYPTLVVSMPDGTEMMNLSGYKHEWQARHLQSLKSAVTRCHKAKETHRKKLEAAGYRLWTDKKGVVVFAKLNAVDANMGSFTGEWGEPFNTFVTRLSDADQAWVAEKFKS